MARFNDLPDPFAAPQPSSRAISKWDMSPLPPPPLSLPIATRLQGTYVLGKNGTGKSSLLVHMIAQDLQDGHGVGVLDPHGDLIVDVLTALPLEREDDVVLLDLQDTEYPFALNLFDCPNPNDPMVVAQTAELVTAVFKRVWGDAIGPRSQDLLENMVYVMVANPGATLDDVPRFFTHIPTRRRMVKQVPNEVVQSYWQDEFELLSASSQQQITAPLLNKIRTFLRHPVLRAIVRQPKAPDFDAILRERKILLVRFNARLEEATSLLGTLITLRLLHAALGRSREGTRHPFFLYADEFQRFATPDFGTLLQEARKFGIGTVLAHQLRSQLSRELRSHVLGAGTIVCFQLTAEDAREMDRSFPADARSFVVLRPGQDALTWLLTTQHAHQELREIAGELNTMLTVVDQVVDGSILTDRERKTLQGSTSELSPQQVMATTFPGLIADASTLRRRLSDCITEALVERRVPEIWNIPILNPYGTYMGEIITDVGYRLWNTCLRNTYARLNRLVLRALTVLLDPDPYDLTSLPVLTALVRQSQDGGIIVHPITVSHVIDLKRRQAVHHILQGGEPRDLLGVTIELIREINREQVATPREDLATQTPHQPDGDDEVFAEEPPPKPKRKRQIPFQ